MYNYVYILSGERSTDFWKCINDMHCTVQVNAIEQSNHVCMCTDDIANRLCTKIICSEKRSETSSVNMDCKYNLEFENASECSASGELGEVVKMERKQAAMRGIVLCYWYKAFYRNLIIEMEITIFVYCVVENYRKKDNVHVRKSCTLSYVVNTMDVLTCSLSGEENACNSEASITISK